MANIPRAGMPDFASVSFGKGAALPTQNGAVRFFGFDKLHDALAHTIAAQPMMLKACLTELGLFGVRETQLATPVRTNVLRASIGVVEVIATPLGESSVTWGTNVEYAPWVEWGFTMATRRAVFFPGVGFRMVNPFSYRGAHMFERGIGRTLVGGEKILVFWAEKALHAGGLSRV
jgi:hypothetical protein